MEPSILLKDIRLCRKALVDELREFYKQLPPKVRGDCFSHKPERLPLTYDLVCQLVLLRVAALSGTPSQVDLLFIQEIGSMGYSLEKYVEEYDARAHEKLEFAYDALSQADADEAVAKLEKVRIALKPLWDDLLNAFAKSGLSQKTKLYRVLEDTSIRIVNCFLLLNDEKSEIEVRLGNEVMRNEILLPIIQTDPDLQDAVIKGL